MTRITVDVNDEWLEAARRVLGTRTKVATINEALHAQAVREQAELILAAFNCVTMDLAGSAEDFGYDGGRDLSRLELAELYRHHHRSAGPRARCAPANEPGQPAPPFPAP